MARRCCSPDSSLSVPKLHFVGSYAVKSFGPLLRFIAGAPYAARAVAQAAYDGAAQQRAGSTQSERVFGAVAAPNVWTPR